LPLDELDIVYEAQSSLQGQRTFPLANASKHQRLTFSVVIGLLLIVSQEFNDKQRMFLELQLQSSCTILMEPISSSFRFCLDGLENESNYAYGRLSPVGL